MIVVSRYTVGFINPPNTSVVRRTLAETGPPPESYDFKARMIGGSGSPLCYATFSDVDWDSK